VARFDGILDGLHGEVLAELDTAPTLGNDFVVAVYFSSKEKATKSEAQNVGKVDAFTVDTSDCPSRAANAQRKFAFSV